MVRAATRTQSLLAQFALALVVIFVLLGLMLHGLSIGVLERIFGSIAERPGGPMTFRFVLQPLVKESPRQSFFYMSDDGDILAIRLQDWKVVLMEQRAKTLQCWFEPFVKLRAPKIFNLRRDPFERADENSNTYWDWVISHAYIIYGMQAVVAKQIENFRKFPPRQKPASFNLDAVMRTLEESTSSANH